MKSADASSNVHVWELPDEAPGTLQEIFSAEDSRRQNLILCEFRKVDGFRRCWEAIGISGNPYVLIDAAMSCISAHLYPLARISNHRRNLRHIARSAQSAATALQQLSLALEGTQRAGWSWRLKNADLPDPTDPRTIEDLQKMAAGLENMLAGDGFRETGGRPANLAFKRLIIRLADVFEQTTGHPAAVTRHHYPQEGYSGRFWELVEVAMPIIEKIIETSGTGGLAKPNSSEARGRSIEKVLQEMRRKKPATAPG